MKTSKVILTALLLVSLLVSMSLSQITNSDSVNSLSKGHISFQFGIGQNLTLEAFNGYALSCKYNVSNHSAARLGFAVSFKTNEGNRTRDSITRDYIENAHAYTIDPAFLFYINGSTSLTFFFGAGPVYSFSHYESKTTSDFYDIESFSQDKWEAGGKILIGCEWFFVKRVSVFADYEATFTAGHDKENREFYDTRYGYIVSRKADIDLTTLRTGASRLGFSVYF